MAIKQWIRSFSAVLFGLGLAVFAGSAALAAPLALASTGLTPITAAAEPDAVPADLLLAQLAPKPKVAFCADPKNANRPECTGAYCDQHPDRRECMRDAYCADPKHANESRCKPGYCAKHPRERFCRPSNA